MQHVARFLLTSNHTSTHVPFGAESEFLPQKSEQITRFLPQIKYVISSNLCVILFCFLFLCNFLFLLFVSLFDRQPLNTINIGVGLRFLELLNIEFSVVLLSVSYFLSRTCEDVLQDRLEFLLVRLEMNFC